MPLIVHTLSVICNGASNRGPSFTSQASPNTSSKPIRTSYYSYSQCSARVEISRRDGGRNIIISVNGRDENFQNLDANDSSVFRFCCSFFSGNCPPTVIIGSWILWNHYFDRTFCYSVGFWTALILNQLLIIFNWL